jgi:hypothetical protein
MEPLWHVGRADGPVRSAGRTPNALEGSSVDDSCSRTGVRCSKCSNVCRRPWGALSSGRRRS